MVDIAADGGWLETTLGVMRLVQMVTQGRFLDASALSDLPHVDAKVEATLRAKGMGDLSSLCQATPERLKQLLGGQLRDKAMGELVGVLRTLPLVRVHAEPPKEALAAGEEAVLTVHLEATQPGSRRNAFAPRFPKPKLAGWWLVMGEAEELFALKRVHLGRGRLSSELQFAAPDEPGEYLYRVMLVSDSYIGLDQEIEVRVVVA